jgi:glycosyltransferase involved in cell wall biosynthesis
MKHYDSLSELEDRKVCMFVFNNFTHDSRVLKEALSLSKIGCSVTVIALLDNDTLPLENISGIRVKRISINPTRHSRNYLMRKIIFWSAVLFKKRTQTFVEPVEETRFRSLMNKTNTPLRLRKEFFKYVSEILKNGIIKPYVSLLIKFKRPFLLLCFNYKIFKLAKSEKYNVFHAHDLNTLLGGYLASINQDAKLIYDSHELYLERNRFQPYNPIGKWMRKRVEAYLIKRSNYVITVNDSLSRIIANTYKVKLPAVIMNTPSLEKVTPNSQYLSIRDAIGIQNNHYVLLYSGSITFNRGLENLIQALVYLPQCFLVLMGFGNDKYKKKLENIATELGVKSRFDFFGPVPSNQVTLYAEGADLGVAPIENVCLSYYYCSPNKLFEYLLAGLPVIASNFPEMAHIIDQYDVGTTFDPSIPKDIARAAMEILKAPEKWKNIKKNTNAVALNYNWENESRKLIDIYQTLF